MTIAYDVFVSEAPAQPAALPNGAPRSFSPIASTLIYGQENAVLSDPGFSPSTASDLGDWVASKGRRLTDIYITHGHGDHWFAAQLLADRFGLVVAGDVIYNGAHQYVGDALGPDGLAPWQAAIDNVEALAPRTIVAI